MAALAPDVDEANPSYRLRIRQETHAGTPSSRCRLIERVGSFFESFNGCQERFVVTVHRRLTKVVDKERLLFKEVVDLFDLRSPLI